jgi:hypothetical protein
MQAKPCPKKTAPNTQPTANRSHPDPQHLMQALCSSFFSWGMLLLGEGRRVPSEKALFWAAWHCDHSQVPWARAGGVLERRCTCGQGESRIGHCQV